MNEWRNWRLVRRDHGIAEVWLAVADHSVNVLNRDTLSEMETLLEVLEADPPSGIVLSTDPDRGFSVGADVHEFSTLRDQDAALELLHRGQKLFERWHKLLCPTVAAIRGHCLGGGLELALACDYRVAQSDAKTRLGLPEVRLGIHPGYGGSVRLPRLIGDWAGLRMMMSGRAVSARAAKRLGLVDATAPGRQLQASALALLRDLPSVGRPHWLARVPHFPRLRTVLSWPMVAALRKRFNPDHYPAPFQLLAYWRQQDGHVPSDLESEARSVASLFKTPTAHQLVNLFLLREEIKRTIPSGGTEICHIHVIGAGVMGGDIAAWCALRGLKVTLQDTDTERLAAAIKRATHIFSAESSIQASMDRLIPDPRGAGASTADVVIEAIFEDRAAKQELYRELEPRMRPQALLATNTSSLPLEELSEALSDPRRLIGLHFFNPVNRMPLIEVIHHHPEQKPLVEQGMRFARCINRVPLAVRSSPGFLVNRVMQPYLLEAMRLQAEGLTPATIDRAAREYGMPMGPLELADMIGLDICLAVGSRLAQAYRLDVPPELTKMVENGQLGRKSGHGFYRWKHGRAVRGIGSRPPPDCIDRLILSLVREAVHCLHEGLVERADWLDAGIILGTGFAPFRGGPLQVVRTRKVELLRTRLVQLEEQYGRRFSPGSGWEADELRDRET